MGQICRAPRSLIDRVLVCSTSTAPANIPEHGRDASADDIIVTEDTVDSVCHCPERQSTTFFLMCYLLL